VGRNPLFFSIIVATYRRSEHLNACLGSLCHLDYPRHRFEVLVVDDGGRWGCESGLSPFKERMQLSLLTQEHAGPAKARNRGAARAQGQYLAFTDDDCAPARDWLQVLGAKVEAAPECVIGGRTVNALPRNPYSSASQLLIDFLYRCHNQRPGQARFLTSNNLVVPAERFRSIKGFDTSFHLAGGEDRELCDRWLHHGYGMIYAPEAIVYHAHSLTLNTFWRQHFNYGRGAFQFRRVRASRGSGRIKLESRNPGPFIEIW
jgi:GT2 family glycosyltransferase